LYGKGGAAPQGSVSRFWAGGHSTTALSFLRGFRPCAPIRERVLTNLALIFVILTGIPTPAISCSFSAIRFCGSLRHFPAGQAGIASAAIVGLLAAPPGAPSCRHPSVSCATQREPPGCRCQNYKQNKTCPAQAGSLAVLTVARNSQILCPRRPHSIRANPF
jgi:hypothetical protein